MTEEYTVDSVYGCSGDFRFCESFAKKFGCNRETSGDARCGIKDASDVEVWFWMGVSGFGWIDDRSGPSKDTKE